MKGVRLVQRSPAERWTHSLYTPGPNPMVLPKGVEPSADPMIVARAAPHGAGLGRRLTEGAKQQSRASRHLQEGTLRPIFGYEKSVRVKAHFAVYPARHAKRPPVEAFLAWIHTEAARTAQLPGR